MGWAEGGVGGGEEPEEGLKKRCWMDVSADDPGRGGREGWCGAEGCERDRRQESFSNTYELSNQPSHLRRVRTTRSSQPSAPSP